MIIEENKVFRMFEFVGIILFVIFLLRVVIKGLVGIFFGGFG